MLSNSNKKSQFMNNLEIEKLDLFFLRYKNVIWNRCENKYSSSNSIIYNLRGREESPKRVWTYKGNPEVVESLVG